MYRMYGMQRAQDAQELLVQLALRLKSCDKNKAAAGSRVIIILKMENE